MNADNLNLEGKEPAMIASPVEGFIDTAAVVARLGLSQRTVDEWRKRGLLPYYKVGRSVLFKWSEIEDHLANTCRVCRRRGGVQ